MLLKQMFSLLSFLKVRGRNLFLRVKYKAHCKTINHFNLKFNDGMLKISKHVKLCHI